jgi:blocked-early-in-transport protein 1
LYPGGSSGYGVGGGGSGGRVGGMGGEDVRDGIYRAATPNSRGQYSAAVLDELESQNDEQVGVLTSKVRMLKDVCFFFHLLPVQPTVWSVVANVE